MTNSPYLSPSELSELLRTSLKWTYCQLNKGNIPGSFKLSGIWMIDKQIFTDALKQKAQTPKPAKEMAHRKSKHNLL